VRWIARHAPPLVAAAERMIREQHSGSEPHTSSASAAQLATWRLGEHMAWEQACQQCRRTLANGLKAKLALIDDGISTVEREFLADIVIPSTGQTYGELAIPLLSEVYEKHQLPPIVPGSGGGGKVIELPERTAK
jgi:hypothetical protein